MKVLVNKAPKVPAKQSSQPPSNYPVVDLTGSTDGDSANLKRDPLPTARVTRSSTPSPSNNSDTKTRSRSQLDAQSMARKSTGDGDDAKDTDYQEDTQAQKVSQKRKAETQVSAVSKRAKTSQASPAIATASAANVTAITPINGPYVIPGSRDVSHDSTSAELKASRTAYYALDAMYRALDAENSQMKKDLKLANKTIKDNAKLKVQHLAQGALSVDAYSNVTRKVEQLNSVVQSWVLKWARTDNLAESLNRAEGGYIQRYMIEDHKLGTANGLAAVLQHKAGAAIVAEALLNNILSRQILMRPFFFLDEHTDGPEDLESSLDWLMNLTTKGSRGTSVTWRSILVCNFVKNDLVEDELSETELSFERSITAAREKYSVGLLSELMDSPLPFIFKKANEAESNRREKSLLKLLLSAGELSTYLWSQGFDMKCEGNSMLRTRPFKKDSADIVEHSTMLLKMGDESLYGRKAEFIVCPRILAYGNDKLEKFEVKRPIQKACFWFMKEENDTEKPPKLPQVQSTTLLQEVKGVRGDIVEYSSLMGEASETGIHGADVSQSSSPLKEATAQGNAIVEHPATADETPKSDLNGVDQEQGLHNSRIEVTKEEVELSKSAPDGHILRSGNVAPAQPVQPEQAALKAQDTAQQLNTGDLGQETNPEHHQAENASPRIRDPALDIFDLIVRVNQDKILVGEKFTAWLAHMARCGRSLEEIVSDGLQDFKKWHAEVTGEFFRRALGELICRVEQDMEKDKGITNKADPTLGETLSFEFKEKITIDTKLAGSAAVVKSEGGNIEE